MIPVNSFDWRVLEDHTNAPAKATLLSGTSYILGCSETRKDKSAAQTRKKFTDVYGEDVLTVRQCQNWFAKFRSGNIDVEDAPRSGRPVEADKDMIKALVDANRRITNLTVYDHLKGLAHHYWGRKMGVYMSSARDHGAKKIIAQSISKANIHQRKILPDNTTINSEVHCHQLVKLNDTLQQERPELINKKGVVFHQDNPRPHLSLILCRKLSQLELDTMSHPPYYPDLTPSDYYLFRLLQNFLDGKIFSSNEEVKNHLYQIFDSKDPKFHERRIMLVPGG
ncbi:histone-lysine N-methyltransferase SETMAR-like [Vespa mandarinia]|uniref:histone-lysine N-methyltransferase SETMAR-like n=1 Tax=Vespa mandarinia TaxID=7446 RepID=UPI001610E22D|nr:histone-lysine N-methyltransferase SETMAR-like [Vespa mandarinia]